MHSLKVEFRDYTNSQNQVEPQFRCVCECGWKGIWHRLDLEGSKRAREMALKRASDHVKGAK